MICKYFIFFRFIGELNLHNYQISIDIFYFISFKCLFLHIAPLSLNFKAMNLLLLAHEGSDSDISRGSSISSLKALTVVRNKNIVTHLLLLNKDMNLTL